MPSEKFLFQICNLTSKNITVIARQFIGAINNNNMNNIKLLSSDTTLNLHRVTNLYYLQTACPLHSPVETELFIINAIAFF